MWTATAAGTTCSLPSPRGSSPAGARQNESEYKGKECAIKVWKGDYLNLGAGAEIGIYSKGGLQWKVEKSLAMRMSMTLRLDGNIIADYSAKHWLVDEFCT